MKTAVIGCGAMGSIYAALLADAGHAVTGVCRSPERAAVVAAEGLRISGASGERTVRLPMTAVLPNEAFDLVVVAVKATQVAEVAPNLARLLKPRSIVLALQNGIGSADILAEHVPPQQLAVGIAGGFGAELIGPAHAHHNGMQVVRMGPFRDLSMERVEEIAALWQEAGLPAAAVENIAAMQWEKLICNAAYSPICALTGLCIGEVADHPHLAKVSRAAAIEAWSVARAAGIGLAVDDPVGLAAEFAARMPRARPSLLQDLEAGRPTEIDVINGAVVSFGRSAEVETPVNDTLVALLKTREAGGCGARG